MNPVDDFLCAITEAAIDHADEVWAHDAVLDATVPNWRVRACGPEEIRRIFSGWYADPGQFQELHRTPLPDGELVQFLLTWIEHGVAHAAHQAHIFRLYGDRIGEHVVYCGGRWPAGLLAEMSEASGE